MRFLIILSFFFSCAYSTVAQPRPALEITHLTDNFYIYKTYNLYQGNYTSANAMYLITNKGAVLFDTPWDETQFQPLLDSIEHKHHKKVIMIIATHSHEDRAGGFDFYNKKHIPTYSTKLTDEILKKDNKARAIRTFKNDTTFIVGQHKFQTYYAGEGHTKDNMVIWFPKDRILYGGCLIKSIDARTLGFTGEANLQEWPRTLHKLKQRYPSSSYIITGHDNWRSTKSIDHTLKLLK
jgi:metallo-beta-lactamase class B